MLSLSLGKQPGAGGANWIQLFGDSLGMMFAFQTESFRHFKKTRSQARERNPVKAGPNEATIVDFRP